MAPTIIVGDDENAGDVAGELLKLADNQRQVRVRTDLSSAAFEVPDAVYKKYVGRRSRSDEEQRVNAVDDQQRKIDAGDPDAIVGDELPDSAKVAEPGDGDDLTKIVGDELPDSAKIVEPPSNGDAGGADADDPETPNDPETPKPRKRASRSRARAAKSTPAGAAGGAE